MILPTRRRARAAEKRAIYFLPHVGKASLVKTTRYFTDQVLRKRPYIDVAWCAAALEKPVRRIVQPDGRIRHWIEVRLPGSDKGYMLRVVTLADGETVHNAFLDRSYREDEQ